MTKVRLFFIAIILVLVYDAIPSSDRITIYYGVKFKKAEQPSPFVGYGTTEYYLSNNKKVILFEGSDGMYPLRNCIISDIENWQCLESDTNKTISMADGKIYETSDIFETVSSPKYIYYSRAILDTFGVSTY